MFHIIHPNNWRKSTNGAYQAYEHSLEMLQLKRDYELTPISLHIRINLFQIIEKVNRVLMPLIREKKEKEIDISLLKYSEISGSKFRAAYSNASRTISFNTSSVISRLVSTVTPGSMCFQTSDSNTLWLLNKLILNVIRKQLHLSLKKQILPVSTGSNIQLGKPPHFKSGI